jgi:putative permease
MLKVFTDWYKRYFSNPEAVMLFLSLLFLLLLITTMGRMLAPVLAAVIIAYLLQGLVNIFERLKIPHKLAVVIVFIIFVGLLVALMGFLPALSRQATALVNEIPAMLGKAQAMMMTLPENYPEFVTEVQIQSIIRESKGLLTHWGQWLLSFSLASIPGLITLAVYLILVPLLVYFFLMDKKLIIEWFRQFMPHKRRLIIEVWGEVNEQIWNYVSGKVMEILIIAAVSYALFAVLGLQYALLLAVLVGLSVIIPYIGAIVVTIPITVMGFIQWGVSSEFMYLVIGYLILQALDANVLVPLLFSEVMQLHPVAIIIAILIFGGIWGFWGVFFAIPLATVVKAVLSAWPQASDPSLVTG